MSMNYSKCVCVWRAASNLLEPTKKLFKFRWYANVETMRQPKSGAKWGRKIVSKLCISRICVKQKMLWLCSVEIWEFLWISMCPCERVLMILHDWTRQSVSLNAIRCRFYCAKYDYRHTYIWRYIPWSLNSWKFLMAIVSISFFSFSFSMSHSAISIYCEFFLHSFITATIFLCANAAFSTVSLAPNSFVSSNFHTK